MNPINRVGQKVICVVSSIEWLINVCSQLNDFPVEHQVYTVIGFAQDHRGQPAIYLEEVAGYNCSCYEKSNQPWDIRAFKPVRTGEEDISIFTNMLIDKKVSKKIPIKEDV